MPFIPYQNFPNNLYTLLTNPTIKVNFELHSASCPLAMSGRTIRGLFLNNKNSNLKYATTQNSYTYTRIINTCV